MVSNFIKIFPKGGGQIKSKISQIQKIPIRGGDGGVCEFGNVSQIIPVINYEGFP